VIRQISDRSADKVENSVRFFRCIHLIELFCLALWLGVVFMNLSSILEDSRLGQSTPLKIFVTVYDVCVQ
jgi:hypothetical protein